MEAALIEREQLEGLIAAAGPDATGQIIAAFVRSTESLLSDLRQQAADGDFRAARCTAHAIKGSAANMGAVELARAAGGLEANCKAGLIDLTCVDALSAIYDRTAPALESLLTEFC